MKILHLSDFHLNTNNLNDWNDYIKEALFALITENIDTVEDFFIVCSGDLVDKAGKDFQGIGIALNKFKECVIDEIVGKFNLPGDHFIITPGNHDVDRNIDDNIVNSGLRTNFSNVGNGVEELNKYARNIIVDGDKKYTKRMIAYKNFEKELYANSDNVITSFMGTSFKFVCGGKNVCFNAINTSWLAYDDNDRKFGIAISEPQYTQLKQNSADADIRIAVMHHPIDWLKYEKSTIAKWLYKDYTIMLIGHVHEGDTSIITKLSGTSFINVAPCFTNDIRSTSISFANGVTLIDFDVNSRKIRCSNYIYKMEPRKYVLNNDEDGESGVLEMTIPLKGDNRIDGIVEHSLEYIKERHFSVINEGLIPQKAKVASDLKEVYIHMPIVAHGDDDKQVDLCFILNNSQNQIFFGPGDSGKTVLLQRILMEYVDNFQQYNLLPVYIDFNEIGNREVMSLLKDYLDCNTNQVNDLLSKNMVVILLDNYNSLEESKFQRQRIQQFLESFAVKIIATSHNSLHRVPPTNFIDKNCIAFEYFYIEPFKAENIKQLMVRWSPNDEYQARNNKLEKMVSNFCSYSLPCTALSVSLYLWSTENANREPINQAILLDIYIELILEKLAKENIYHNTFDYKNKTLLLAYLAKYMHDKEISSIKCGELIDQISEYLNKVGFKTFEADRLAQYLIDRKILTQKGNTISFAHSCFYYFFLARRMENEPDFYKHVLSKDNFYKYDRVIEYYSGLVRKDDFLINELFHTFKEYFAGAQPIYDEIDPDDCFTNVTERPKKFEPVVDKVDLKKAIMQKPSQEVVEKRIQEVADERLSKITDQINNNPILTPDKFLVLMCQVLRNLDGIEDVQLKTTIYSEIVKDSIIYSICVKNLLAIYANTHQGKLPPQYSKVKDVELFLRCIPFNVQHSLHEYVGTTKLCKVFENKLSDDYECRRSDVEKFISLGMLWDTNNLANTKRMKQFINSAGKNISRDYVLLKLYWHYLYKVVAGSKEEDEYISLLSQLQSKLSKIPWMKHLFTESNLKRIKEERDNITGASPIQQ